MERKELADNLIKQASRRIKEVYLRGGIDAVQKEGGRSIVTELDKEIEGFIIKGIRDNFPQDGIIAEEGGSKNGQNDFKWFIDPIDGTRNFVFGIPFFSISIALTQGQELKFGLISDPVQGIIFEAERGKGAYKNNVPIKTSSILKLGDAISLLGFTASGVDLGHDKKTAKLLERLVRVRILGSAALNFCLVAEGHVASAIGFGFHSWDIAAGIIIVEEAGGRITNDRGESVDLFNGDLVSVVASNGTVHDKLLSIISEL